MNLAQKDLMLIPLFSYRDGVIKRGHAVEMVGNDPSQCHGQIVLGAPSGQQSILQLSPHARSKYGVAQWVNHIAPLLLTVNDESLAVIIARRNESHASKIEMEGLSKQKAIFLLANTSIPGAPEPDWNGDTQIGIYEKAVCLAQGHTGAKNAGECGLYLMYPEGHLEITGPGGTYYAHYIEDCGIEVKKDISFFEFPCSDDMSKAMLREEAFLENASLSILTGESAEEESD